MCVNVGARTRESLISSLLGDDERCTQQTQDNGTEKDAFSTSGCKKKKGVRGWGGVALVPLSEALGFTRKPPQLFRERKITRQTAPSGGGGGRTRSTSARLDR